MKFTSQKKVELVQRLVVAIEQRQVSWLGLRSLGEAGPKHQAFLTDELRRYEYTIGPTGGITYSAPAGFHDDCVMGLALAATGRHSHIATADMAVLRALSGPRTHARRVRFLMS